jgi:uncharacterized protein YndB with AHSA1/START domain
METTESGASGAGVIEREVRIEARPETVFGYFTDPVKMLRWKGVEAALDPRAGGIYRVRVHHDLVAKGEYLEIVPYSRVVFTWGWEGDANFPPGSSTVEVSLVPDGDATVVRLRHSGLDAEGAGQFDAGWQHYLPRLALAAAGGDAGPDPWAEQFGGMPS